MQHVKHVVIFLYLSTYLSSLLITDLKKRTPEGHVDKQDLQRALEEVQRLTVHVDEQIKRMQNSDTEQIEKDHPWIKEVSIYIYIYIYIWKE